AMIRNDAGEQIGMVVVFRDVTDERALQIQLLHSQKMDAIGKLAGGVAHDFNNMLGGIMGAAELLETSVQSNPEALNFVKIILEASDRAAQLTSKLLAFARRQPVIPRPLNLIEPLNEAVELLKRTIDRRIRIEKNLVETELKIVGDFSQLPSAFLNLLINASQAREEGGSIIISARKTDLQKCYCDTSQFKLKPGPFAEIEIRDTGCGIPEENLQRIFEPFFTTKTQGKGTGLGLAAVFGTMQQHNGAVNVYSEVGTGTSFRLLLPLALDETEIPESNSREFLRGKGRILIVDDEPMMRTIASEVLSELGYEILLAENGRQAVSVFSENAESVSLVILDMIMPEMNGKECFLELKKIRPDLRVIVSSGFTHDKDIEQMRDAGAGWFINKPFRLADLSKIVHDAMAANP
ncbi:MAG: response regulator, partial [Candidatus Riflebacteria bacterium]|nr:response regulator [Candidatus Riflebacteria bacterium]